MGIDSKASLPLQFNQPIKYIDRTEVIIMLNALKTGIDDNLRFLREP